MKRNNTERKNDTIENDSILSFKGRSAGGSKQNDNYILLTTDQLSTCYLFYFFYNYLEESNQEKLIHLYKRIDNNCFISGRTSGSSMLTLFLSFQINAFGNNGYASGRIDDTSGSNVDISGSKGYIPGDSNSRSEKVDPLVVRPFDIVPLDKKQAILSSYTKIRIDMILFSKIH